MVSGRSSSLLSLGAGLAGLGTGLLGISADLLAGTGSVRALVPLLAGAGAGAGAVAKPAEGATVLKPSGLSSSLSDMMLYLGPSSQNDQAESGSIEVHQQYSSGLPATGGTLGYKCLKKYALDSGIS